MNKTIKIICGLLMSTLSLSAFCCTSAIIGADATLYGRPLLWKLRDTSTIDNKIEYISSQYGEYSYVGLFNADDIKCRQIWIGMNDVGFAIMNTASYNLKDDNIPQKEMDKEGYLMSVALKSCQTVDDFQKMLDKYPRPMGIEANFGVIDAFGGAAFFETNNYTYCRFDVNDAPGHVLIRTNYSISGRKDEGYGYIRYANTEYLLQPFINTRNITPEILTEIVSRSFYHSLMAKNYEYEKQHWVIDQDFIPRFKSTATIVIEGIEPIVKNARLQAGALLGQYIMWTGLGYPPCCEIIPVWCCKNGVDDCLRGIGPDGHSQQSDIVKKRRDDVFSIKRGNGNKYIDMTKLFNDRGTGYVQQMQRLNKQTYEKTRQLTKSRNE